MWSYGGSVHARRALSRLITRRNPYCCTAEPLASAALTTTTTTTKSPGEDTCATSCISSAAVALACLLASTDSEASLKHAGSSDDGIRGGRAYCRGQKIVWVDSYGRKVAVQEKDMPNHALATQENATDGAIPRFCPYVIVGFGIAGQAALRALLERDPAAHVLVVDARSDGPEPPPPAQLPKTAKVEYLRGTRAISLDPDRGLLVLTKNVITGSRTGAAASDGGLPPTGVEGKHPESVGTPLVLQPAKPAKPKSEEIAFGRCLLALGSMPRFPPRGFVDPQAWKDMALLGWRDRETREGLKRDIEEGKSVTIVGSSWEALELACSLQEGRGSNSETGQERGQCRMVFPDFAPLDHILPRYLSVALLRRLNKRNIKTMGHHSIRWVGMRNSSGNGHHTQLTPPPSSLPTTPASVITKRLDRYPEPTIPPQPQNSPRRDQGRGTATAGTGVSYSAGKILQAATGVQSQEPSRQEAALAALPATQSAAGGGQAHVRRKAESAVATQPTSTTTTQEQRQESKTKVELDEFEIRRRQHWSWRGNMTVMTSQTFDHLHTSSHATDRVVLAGLDAAPVTNMIRIDGTSGTGTGNDGGRRSHRGSGALEVDPRRGAVVVNAELAASSRVWAAGDVACFPSYAHGGRRVVLRSADHAHHSGLIAGYNMAASAAQDAAARDAAAEAAASGVKSKKRRGDSRGEGGGAGGPIRGNGGGMRYCHTPAFVAEAPLAGVRMATIGDCNAAYSTHGFWWTNRATGLVKNSTIAGKDVKGAAGRVNGVTLRSRKTARKEFTPVFGTGVVFYTHGPEVKGAMLWGFPGAAAIAANTARREKNNRTEKSGGTTSGDGPSAVDDNSKQSAEDAAAGLSLRALDLLREIMKRSAGMQVDLSDERVMAAWMQGLSDAAQVVAQESGLGHLQPVRRSLAGRDTSATRRKPGTRDDLLYENPNKTVSAEARSAAAFEAAFRGQAPAAQAPVAPAPNGYYGGSWNVDDDDADVGDGYWGGFIRSDDVVGGGG